MPSSLEALRVLYKHCCNIHLHALAIDDSSLELGIDKSSRERLGFQYSGIYSLKESTSLDQLMYALRFAMESSYMGNWLESLSQLVGFPRFLIIIEVDTAIGQEQNQK